MSETGSIKFAFEQAPVEISCFDGFDELNRCRRELLKLGMIGVDARGISFGNISVREDESSRFYITGSATGQIRELALADYARVVAYDFAGNWLRCEGSRIASSESLTHAAVYESDPTARVVIHCHDVKLWAALVNKVPTTPKPAEYGTPEMAYAVRRLFDVTDVKTRKIFVMEAHDGGLVTFGRDPQEAFGILAETAKRQGLSEKEDQQMEASSRASD